MVELAWVGRRLLLPPVVDTAVIVEAVERAKHLVTERTNGIVEGLEVLLFLVPLERKFGAEQLAAHVTAMASIHRQRQAHPSQRCIPRTDHREHTTTCLISHLAVTTIS